MDDGCTDRGTRISNLDSCHLLEIRFKHVYECRRVEANYTVIIPFNSFDVGLADPFLDAICPSFIKRFVGLNIMIHGPLRDSMEVYHYGADNTAQGYGVVGID